MSEKSKQQSTTCTAFGEGLRHASVGKEATFTIKVTNKSVLQYPMGIVYSALAVGENHMFVAKPLPYSRGSDEIPFSYTPTMEGEYDFYIEQLNQRATDQLQIPGSPFRLVVLGKEVNEEAQRTFTDSLPSCQTISQNNLTWVEGSWVTRKLAGSKHGVLRSGWVFQPKICSFDVFTEEELAVAVTSSEPTSIVILGSSIERGIFLSLVDLILNHKEKVHFNESHFDKCWGYAQLQVGNVQIVYQDYRIEPASRDHLQSENNFTVTCHNEKKVSQGYNFFDDALGFLQDFLFKDRPWPDVILVCLKDSRQLKSLFEKIPPSWKGVIYPTTSFKIKTDLFYTASGVRDYRNRAQKFPLIDKRVQIVDAFALSTGVRHGSGSSPLILKSNHFHRWCNELGGKMRVCGDATEMVAQLLLGKAIAPKGKDVWMKSVRGKDRDSVGNMDSREIMVCHDCPQSLLPFHIKRIPDLKCYKTRQGLRPAEEKNFKVWDGTLCPNECLKTKPVGQAQTESGPVDVRECTVSV
ncbi:hypothetical protein HOLleu_04550 [Holothuria leucospilota]|uniref:Uncharacterized protein n=1 Tax=Holothuria leucospilota TaxID=206669 RepID=A0A9Q1HMF4_HOLLE|nr:hypothetical protein HOLleu_04550 [Holothuria leucospilota]